MAKTNQEKRVRYVKAGTGILRSMRNFTTRKGLEVRVELDTVNKKFAVVDAVEGTIIVEGGNTVNLSILKIKAKTALLKLGVKFDEEVRKRKDV
jgi:hypothetical protein